MLRWLAALFPEESPSAGVHVLKRQGVPGLSVVCSAASP